MARERFSQDTRYAGRLLAVRQRPLENQDPRIYLLRLEFEVFVFDEELRRLTSYGRVASRDLVITCHASQDPGLISLIKALNISQPDALESWCEAERRWVKIQFGSVDPQDERNRLHGVFPFSPDGYEVREFDYSLAKIWVTCGQAANSLGVSEPTVRRIIERHLPEWGHRLVVRTEGNHRKINLLLLRNLEEGQITRKVERLSSENKELKMKIRVRDDKIAKLMVRRRP